MVLILASSVMRLRRLLRVHHGNINGGGFLLKEEDLLRMLLFIVNVGSHDILIYGPYHPFITLINGRLRIDRGQLLWLLLVIE